jgi:membrane protein implicated in regulation of membrane protease activity
MSDSVFFETEFLILIFFALVLPVCIYAFMMVKKAISRKTVPLSGVILITISGVSIFLLQRLAEMAESSPSLFND